MRSSEGRLCDDGAEWLKMIRDEFDRKWGGHDLALRVPREEFVEQEAGGALHTEATDGVWHAQTSIGASALTKKVVAEMCG